MNVPETIGPGEGIANLKERAAAMTVAPHVMNPATEAAAQQETTVVRAEADATK